MFNENEFVKIQITYADVDSKVHESDVLRLEVGEVLNEREF